MLLYSLVEAQKTLFAHPMEMLSSLGAQILNASPTTAYVPGAKEMQAYLHLNTRILKSYQRPHWNIEKVQYPDGSEDSVHLHIVTKRPFANLLHFKTTSDGSRSDKPTVLIVAPLSGHYPTLLRDTVRQMLLSHDVFITEWINVRDVPIHHGEFSLDSYIQYIMDFLKLLHQQGRKVHMMSVCQPTVPALCAQSILAQNDDPAQAASMIMIGGPIDARKSPTAVTNFALEHDIHWFERHLISMVPFPYQGAGRLVYPGFLQHMGFVAMNPRRHAQAHHQFFESLTTGDESSASKHREFYDEYNAVMDLPKTFYLDTIEKVFQKFDLPQGNFYYQNQKVCPQSISRGGLLTIEGSLDDISGSGQTHAAQDLCSSIPNKFKDIFTAQGVGHYGVFSGSKFASHIVPKIEKFIQKLN